MRVKLTLASTKRAASPSLDYQFALASLIYATLGDASAAFSAKLYDDGFRVEKRTFKLFTFSRLRAQRGRAIKDHLLLEEPQVSFQIISPQSGLLSFSLANCSSEIGSSQSMLASVRFADQS